MDETPCGDKCAQVKGIRKTWWCGFTHRSVKDHAPHDWYSRKYASWFHCYG